jgi:hypothetical protein
VTSTPPNRFERFELRDGRVVCVERDNHVWITNPEGTVVSESCARYCGGYRAVVAFWTKLQNLLEAHDVPAVAELTAYPLRVYFYQDPNHGHQIWSRSEFEREFDIIFSKTVRGAVARADPRGVFCNWEGAMLGDGVFLALGTTSLRLVMVNQPISASKPTTPRPSARTSVSRECSELTRPSLECD